MDKRIGFTAGAFDMFHIGHLNLIHNAKKYCDYLIVGVNSDELIEQYKLKKPVIPFEERIKITFSIKGVDEAIRVSTLDKEAIWNETPYNMLFIGSDWKGHERWVQTEKVMAAHGVKVIYLPYTNNTSSSIIREKILEY